MARLGRLLGLVLLVAALAVGGLIILSRAAPGLLGLLGARPRPPEGIDPKTPVDPNRRYHLVVWESRLPLSSPGGAAFAQAAERAIRRFEARYPNVEVDLHLVDPAEGPARLAEALSAGYPPDVYSSPFGPVATSSPLQVPVGPYLDAQTWSRYHPVAWQAVKVDGVVWAWPRWLMLWPWLGNRDLLVAAGVDPERVSREGWTTEEFALAAGRLGSSSSARMLAAPNAVVVLRDVLFGAHLSAGVPPAADVFWQGDNPAAAAAWLAALRKEGALLQAGTGVNPLVLESFWRRQVAVLACPSPWVAMFALELVPRLEPWEFTLPGRRLPPLVLLPPPHEAGRPPVVWVSAAPVLVFRQARYRGDDNTRLAVELALELSSTGRAWLRDEVLCLPAAWSGIASWRLRLERFGEAGRFALAALEHLAALPSDRLSQALSAVDYGPRPPPAPVAASGAEPAAPTEDKAPYVFTGAGYLGPYLAGTVAPLAEAIWKGEAGPEDLARELRSGARSPAESSGQDSAPGSG